ncbi:Purine catabolism regulatory protein [Mycobacterium basiliense]|uniref:Purine catabolism regulatory protein n=1 Tax=Mycobacterium basiliense TaxID=2094119 RepID=A0A447GI32_9MYCO|nr:PucR family transcriptional regulator [Mycobacterium basiliense]VDM90114.1 Purine catabolism regulatory protein [Mycobacterium basiliense]
MAWQLPSPRIRELIREGARIALNAGPEWIDELDRSTVSANPAIANDPVLAKVVKRANRANLVHWAAANMRDPGAPVPANLGGEPLRMARDLVRRGLDALALDVYRIGQYMAWRLWMEIAFDLTSDPQELRELLDVSARSVNEFIEATLAGIAAQVQLEHDELTRGTHAERLEVVGLILDGAPIARERAETRLGYPLNLAHTAAIVWSDELDGDHSNLDRATDAFSHAVGSVQPLTVVASAASRWVWLAEASGLDIDTVEQAMDCAPGARIAIGTTASGTEGFRRSHLEALTTQRTLARLQSDQRVAFFSDVQMVALITQNPEAAREFITSTLGELEAASPELQATLLTFINEQCNASRAAKRLYTHRNTLLRRIESAQRLLPRPLTHTSVHVAVALEALQWHGSKIGKLSSPTNHDDGVPA